VEAQQGRADADALGPGVPIIYTGDFNSESSNEAALQTLLGSGNGQAFDPINRLGDGATMRVLSIRTPSPPAA
jgi:hypothetical protein